MARTTKQDEMQSYLEMINKFQKEHEQLLHNISGIENEISEIQQIRADRQEVINELQRNYDDLTKKQKKELLELVKIHNNEYGILKDKIKQQKLQNEQLKKEIGYRKEIVDIAKKLGDVLKEGWNHLQNQDKIIKSTILNLGMSGAKAELMRSSFEGSAIFVARLGGSLADVQAIMEGFADETGRARALSSEMVQNITAIGKGTGLGIEQATKLGAQFEIMGYDTKSTMNYVQGVVDTTERMGVNTTKVLKNVNDNFKKLNTYNFQQGVKGFAQMAAYAEKFKIDIGDALNAADTARTLEGAIDMVAQLQVMGGEFAKMDMFETMYFARNDPAKLQAKIADMTKGLVTLRKNSDGTFEKFISPADRDRLNQVGKALGISAEKMTEMTERQFDITKMSQQLQGIGLTDREKQLIEGAAVFNSRSGRFEVQLAGRMQDISKLTAEQAKSFASEQVMLEDRAKNAQTFNETFKATIEILKSSLLPLLKGVNWLLDNTVKPLADLAASGWGGLAAAATILAGAGTTWWLISRKLSDVAENFISNGSLGSNKTSGVKKSVGGKGSNITGFINKSGTIKKGAGGLAAGQGIKSLGQGAGFGAALAGAGAGIGLAAEGIGKLADAMSKLNKDQAESLASIVKSLSWFTVGAAAAAAGIAIFGTASGAAALPLLAFGAAVLMVGAGIGAAAAGIGFMGEGLSKLVIAGKDAGPSMVQLGAGIGMVAASMLGFTAGAVGFLVFASTMKTIASNADAITRVGNAFGQINAVMSGSKEDFLAVENAVKSISSMNTKGGGMLSELATLLKSPLKVEFANTKVTMVNDITLNLDGHKFMQKTYDVNLAIQKHEALRQGK